MYHHLCKHAASHCSANIDKVASFRGRKNEAAIAFIFRDVVWWMMKRRPKNQKWTNKAKTANSAGIPEGQSLESGEGDWYSTNSACLFCCKSIENMPKDINRKKTQHEIFFLEDICQQYFSPETAPWVVLLERPNICTRFALAFIHASLSGH